MIKGMRVWQTLLMLRFATVAGVQGLFAAGLGVLNIEDAITIQEPELIFHLGARGCWLETIGFPPSLLPNLPFSEFHPWSIRCRTST